MSTSINFLVVLAAGLLTVSQMSQRSVFANSQEELTVLSPDQAAQLAAEYTGFDIGKIPAVTSRVASTSAMGKDEFVSREWLGIIGDSLWKVHFPDVDIKWNSRSGRLHGAEPETATRDFEVFIDQVTGRLVKVVSRYQGPFRRDGEGLWQALSPIHAPGSAYFDVGIPDTPASSNLREVLNNHISRDPTKAQEIEAYCIFVAWTGDSLERPSAMPSDSVPCWWIAMKYRSDPTTDAEGFLIDPVNLRVMYQLIAVDSSGSIRGQAVIVDNTREHGPKYRRE